MGVRHNGLKETLCGAISGAVLIGCATTEALAMDVKSAGDQIILSGQVVEGDVARFQRALGANPGVTTVILRNSPGGHPWSGFRIGEIIRKKGMTTAVSGYCYSSCSRMYLGGKRRIFTDDYPPGFTTIGFHGHYKSDGSLDLALMKKTGLRNWIIRFLDGKADEALVDRWINIPKNSGMARFFNPVRVARQGGSAFFCMGDEPPARQPFGCEAIKASALDIGVATATDLIASNDQAEIRAAVPPAPAPSGFAGALDFEKLPVKSEQGRTEYRRYLELGAHKAFAVSLDAEHWAWQAGLGDSISRAVGACEYRAKGPCALYAVDHDVVWTGR